MCFSRSRRLPPFKDGTERLRFRFLLTVADRDLALVERLRGFLGGGSIRLRPPRKPGWQPSAEFTIGSNRQHLTTTIPFADRYLLTGAKRDHHLAWKAELLAYLEAHDPVGQRPLAVPDLREAGARTRSVSLALLRSAAAPIC